MAEAYAPALQAAGVIVVVFDRLTTMQDETHDFWPLIAAASPDEPGTELDIHADSPLFRFTGGTTGTPKCAAYSYDNLDFIIDSFNAIEDKVFTPATRMLHLAPLSSGSVVMLMPTFMAGGCNLTQNLPDIEQ